MATPAMTGDPNLQRYLRDEYWKARDQGLSKREAHKYSFAQMLQAKKQGFIPEEEIEEVEGTEEPEERENPYMSVLYKE